MKTIAFVFDGMGFGGIERVGIDIVRMCLEMGYDVDIYNLRPSADDFVKNIPSAAKYTSYNMSRTVCPETYSYGCQKWWWGKYAYSVISPILTLKQIFDKCIIPQKKYDVAIAMSGHINDLSFVAKEYIKSKKKICWCHGNLISYLAICDAYTILYRKIDDIVTLSSAGEKDIYAGKKFLYEKNITKIYNPTYIKYKQIDQNKIEKLKKEYGNFVLMIARFEYRKGYDIAIKAVKKLKDNGLDKKILFAGEGELLDEMKNYALKEGVAENCVFLGNCHDIENYIAASYINLLTSRWEGLPTVIIEAMSLGKPCIMTNTDDGEVSHNGEFCMLKEIDDIDGVVEALTLLYEDRELYEKYSKLSFKRSEDFQPEKIKVKIKNLIEGIR